MKKSILIIDDEMIICEYLKKLLIFDGYEVYCAENGIQGLNVLKEKQKDIAIVILDIKMPGMDGMEVLKEIKKEYLDKEVVLTTGNGDIGTAIQSLRLGAFDYISKPIEYEELILCIIRAFEKQDNITERKMAEKALYVSEEKYRTLVEQANEGIAIIQNKIFKYVNPYMCKMLGYVIDELIGTDIVSPSVFIIAKEIPVLL